MTRSRVSIDRSQADRNLHDRSIPLITTANFDQGTQTSTGALSFGGQTVDTEFELVVTEAGAGTSEIPCYKRVGVSSVKRHAIVLVRYRHQNQPWKISK
jgi:hypothetical protein